MTDFYDLLMEMPIFQGLTKMQITSVVEKSKFQFLKFPPGFRVVYKDQQCTHMKFLVSGRVRTVLKNSNDKIRIEEEFIAPNIIAPNFLFGPTTAYPYNVYAVDEVGIMQIDKASFLNLLSTQEVCLVNMLNLTSYSSQKSQNSFNFFTSSSMKEKFASWVLNYTNKKSQSIRIACKPKDIYSVFGVQRSVFINALEELKEQDVIEYDNSSISIKDRIALEDYNRVVDENEEKLAYLIS